VIPISIEGTNFTCYNNFKVDLTKDGIYAIYGEEVATHKKNGIGKTTIEQAIRFALFGITKYKTVDQPIKFGQKEMSVTFEFTHEDCRFKVVRTRKRKGTTTAVLFKDGVNQYYETATLVNKAIEEEIGVTRAIYENSFYLGKSDLTAFTASSLINFLKSVLKLDKFDIYREKAKEVRHNIDIKLSKLLGIQETLSQLQTIKHTKDELKSTIDSSIKKIEKGKEKKQDLKNQSSSIREERDSKQAELRTDNSILKNIKMNLEKAENSGKCPTCNQKLKDDIVIETFRDKVKVLDSKVKTNFPIVEKLIDKMEKYETAMDKIDDIIDELKYEVSEAQGQLNLLSKADNLDHEEVTTQYSKLLSLKEKAENVVKLFSPTELPLHILHKYLPVLEITVNSILGNITDFSIEILTQKETLDGRVKKTCEISLLRHGQIYDVTNLSGGEETLINMAFRIGISKMFLKETNFQLLIIDEGFGALGDINQSIVVNMIRELKRSFRKILIISHVEFIRESFSNENKVKIIKEGDSSTVIQVYNNSEHTHKKGE